MSIQGDIQEIGDMGKALYTEFTGRNIGMILINKGINPQWKGEW